MGNEEDCLDGFTWKGGSEPVTTGIHFWSEIFHHDFEDGRKVAIILIDTQGTFDTRSTMKDCTTIFGLSTLLSSVQIYNLMNNIGEDDLQHLQLFSEYGRMVAKEGDSPFQKLLFLVRDWNFPQEHEYGAIGGQGFLRKNLEPFEGHEEEHRMLRSHIKTCFDKISCFLMPFPGIAVIKKQNFDGKLSDIDKDFKDNLLQLVQQLMSPENLIVKKVKDQPITACEFVMYFKSYFKIFESGELPEAKTIFQATAEVHNKKAVDVGKDFYTTHMAKYCSSVTAVREDILRQQHSETRAKAIAVMEGKQLMGTEEYLNSFIDELENFIEEEWMQYLKANKGKLTMPKIVGIVLALGVAASGTAASGVLGSVLTKALPTGASFIPFLLKLIKERFRPRSITK